MTTMRRSRNRIISDSSSESESAVESDMTDEDVPLCERWKNILRQRKWNIPTATDKVDKKTGQPIKKPNVVLAYNMHMGAVDHTDQILHGIGSFRKTIKCY
ncbi:uncharacterized protein LOC143260572 [Megalopta genalis]|uniref:uncharacterized protein LOC143260572 n=1 Tax=Megalopta genalis TaxID=115081 RepID=UPI003FD4E56D